MTTHIHMKMDNHIRIIASIIVKPPHKHAQLSLSGAVTKGPPHSLPQHLSLTPQTHHTPHCLQDDHPHPTHHEDEH